MQTDDGRLVSIDEARVLALDGEIDLTSKAPSWSKSGISSDIEWKDAGGR